MDAVCQNNITDDAPELSLDAGDIRVINEPGDGSTITCAHGAVWVTQEGLGEDVVLVDGESFRPLEHGKVVVQALDQSVVGFWRGAVAAISRGMGAWPMHSRL